MKELFNFLSRFVKPYRKNLGLSVLFNVLSAILNVFSFALIVPILELLFKINQENYTLIPIEKGIPDLAEYVDNSRFQRSKEQFLLLYYPVD